MPSKHAVGSSTLPRVNRCMPKSIKKIQKVLFALFLFIATVGISFAMPRGIVISRYMRKMPIREKVAQLFILNLEGDETFTPVEDLVPGGYLLFSYNIADKAEKVMRFTSSIKKAGAGSGGIVPYIATDQEGGFVNRLRGVSGPLPSAKRVASVLSPSQAYSLYEMQAKQMKLLGFDLTIAPVVEVETAENKAFLNERSFGSLESVKSYAKAFISAFEAQGVATVIKHFPGNTNTDPHTSLPEIRLSDKSDKTLEKYLAPFSFCAMLKPTGVLMSHARVGVVSCDPACLSREWIEGYLRVRYKEPALVFSDDIYMAALAKNGYPPVSATIKALKAGVNCVMSSEKRIKSLVDSVCDAAIEDEELLKAIDRSCFLILQYKERGGVMRVTLGDELEATDNYPRDMSARVKAFDKVMWENIYFYRAHFQ